MQKPVADQSVSVSEHAIAEFETTGVTWLRGVLSADWLRRLEAAVERELANPGPYSRRIGPQGRYRTGNMSWRNDPDIASFAATSPLPVLAASLMRAHKVNFFCDQLFVKEPGSADSPTPWHHDQVVFPIAGKKTVSFWICLDPVTRETGALEFVTGSHLWGRLFQPRGFDNKPLFGVVDGYEPDTPDIDAEREKYEIACQDMEPGDVVAFTFLTLHGSGGNASNTRRRRAYSMRYTGEDVIYQPNAATMPMLRHVQVPVGAPLDSLDFPIVWPAK